jgi:hypothetical protein
MARLAFVLASLCVSALSLAACGGDSPRMMVEPRPFQAGEGLVVQFEAPVLSSAFDKRWLTLVPLGSPDTFVGDRVLVEPGATEVVVPTLSGGLFELRLHDGYPRRSHHVIGRLPVEVQRRPVARSAPPLWYW